MSTDAAVQQTIADIERELRLNLGVHDRIALQRLLEELVRECGHDGGGFW